MVESFISRIVKTKANLFMQVIVNLKYVISALSIYFFLWASSCLAHNVPAIKVAVVIEPPYIDYKKGKYEGIHVDVLHKLATELNRDLVFVQCPFARCLSLLKSGGADLFIGLIKTEARQEFLSYIPKPFSIQYDPLQFFIRRDGGLQINNYEDLKTLNIGVLRGVSYFKQFDNDDSLNKVELVSYSQMLQMLLKGRIDTFIEREESIVPWIDPKAYRNEIDLANYEYNKGVNSYIAISKKSPWALRIPDLLSAQEKLISEGKISR